MQRRHNESVCCLPNYTNVSIIKLMIKHRCVDVAVSLAAVCNTVLHYTVASLRSESLAGEQELSACAHVCERVWVHAQTHTHTHDASLLSQDQVGC